MAKMSNKLVAMCSVAVGLIYAGSYAVTANDASPASAASATDHTNAATTNESSRSDSNSNSNSSDNSGAAENNSVASSNNDTNSTNTPSTGTKTTYKDGTYTGSGYDRRGTVEVTVKIAKGKITNVEISNYAMHYDESYIDPVLPQEVLQRQSDNIDIVSGATSSSEDFQVAVQQALSQAQQSS